MKKLSAILVSVLLLATMIPLGAVSVGAASPRVYNETEFVNKLNDLRVKYPNGGTYSGTYYENGAAYAWTCHGYACQLFYELFGVRYYADGYRNQKDYTMGTIYAGDFVRLDAGYGPDTHTVLVTKVTNDRIYFTDANYNNKNGIRWDASYTKEDFAKRFTYKVHIPGNTLTGTGTSTPSTPTTYATIDTGVYAIKNKGNQLYMNVAYGLDENAQNIHTYEFGYWNSQLYEITPSTTTTGYMMRPMSSAARVVNVYADNVVSGKNICIYDNTGDGSQRWLFEKVEDGFVIRNVQNPSCVLTVPSGSDVCVQTYTGADSQIWTLENVVSYDANGGTGAPKLQLKNYNESIALSTTIPSKEDYVFKGWATDASATEAQYAAGDEYNSNANVKLYAVWECDHSYDNDCDTACNDCGATRDITHRYSAATCTAPMTCNLCGATSGLALGHTYDDEYDADCNVCDDEREVPEKPIAPSLPADAPAFVVEGTTAREGEEFIIAIRTQRNSGIVSLKLSVSYDADVLELISLEEQDFANVVFSPLTRNPFIVNWADAISPNNTTNGVVVLATFRVKKEAPLGKTEITLTYDPEDVYDENYDNVAFRVENGFVEIVDYILGDVNGDGRVNNKDLGLFQQFLSGWEVSADERAGDVNGDGRVNNKDLGLFQQYLSGWDVTLG